MCMIFAGDILICRKSKKEVEVKLEKMEKYIKKKKNKSKSEQVCTFVHEQKGR